MSQAMIQISQGVVIGNPGQSVLGLSRGTAVTLTDATPPLGATTWAWQVISWPSPLSTPVVLNSPSSQTTTTDPPTTDGVYVVRLIRTDSAGTTVDVRFFGVSDEDGLILPSPGQTANLSNIGPTPTLAVAAGWAGRADATTNDQLDAYLRFVKSRVGRYVGPVQRVNFTSSSPSTVTYTDGADKPFRVIVATGAGLYTEALNKASVPVGKAVRHLVTLFAGAGGFAVRNGTSGPALASFAAPTSGSVAYEIESVFDGTDWVLAQAIPITASTGQVVTSNGTTTVFTFISDANVATDAAIAGTKVSPDFGAQALSAGTLKAANLSAGQYVKTDGNSTLISTSHISISDLLAGGQTQGDILYFNGVTWSRLAAGSSGQVLRTNGSNADPTWAPPDFGAQNITTTGDITGGTVSVSRIQYNSGSTPQWNAVTQVNVAASDHVLTQAEYKSPIIEAVGNTPADRALTFPLVNAGAGSTNGSIWFVRNATTGGFNVHVRGPSGLGVQIPYGGSAVVYTDGTNFYSVGSSGSGGGSSGTAGGDLAGSYPNPIVAALSGTGGVVKAIAPTLAIDGTITSAFSFAPDVSISATGAGFNYVFTGQHGKIGAVSGTGGGVRIVGGNAGSSSSFGGGLEIQLGQNTYDSTKGGIVKVAQASGGSGVLQAWVDGSNNPIGHILDTGFNVSAGKKLSFGGTGLNPVVLTSAPTVTVGSASPSENEPTGSLYLKTGATSTSDVLWVRQGSTWASMGAPAGTAGGDLSASYPNPTVARINGASVPTAGSLTANHVLTVSGASALTYGFIADANIASSAAISGSKITPNFGSQSITGGALSVSSATVSGSVQTAKIVIGSSGPTITKGAGSPVSSMEPNGSIFLRTDGTDGTTALYSYQAGVWYQVGAGGSGSPTGPASGDLSGSYPSPTVAKINGTSVPSTPATNTVLTSTSGTTAIWSLIADANISSGAAISGSKITPNFGSQSITGGTLSVSSATVSGNVQAAKITVGSSGPTVTKGTGVPTTMAEPNGSIFLRTDGTDGTTALYSYQAGAWVSIGTGGGATPTGPASGDLSGSYPSPTVAKINGVSLPGSAPSSGQFLKATSSTALTYTTIAATDLPQATTSSVGTVQLNNDLGGTATSPAVLALTGSSGSVTVRPNSMSWVASATPSLTQATPGSDTPTHDLTITSQAPFGSATTNKSPGNIVLAVPAGLSGLSGKVSFSISGSEQAYLGVNELTLGSSTRLYLGGNTLPAVFSGVGAPGATSAPDGSFYLVRGASSAATAAYIRAAGAWTALGASGSSAASAVTYTDNAPTLGATNVQTALDAFKALAAPGGTRLSERTYAAAYGVSGAQSTSTTTFIGIGIIRFNPAHYFPAIDGGVTKRVKFKAYLETTAGLTGEVRLYDLQLGATVASSTMSTASATPTLLASVDLLGNLAPNVEHDYEVQIRLTGSPTPGDRATCKMAQLEVTYT